MYVGPRIYQRGTQGAEYIQTFITVMDSETQLCIRVCKVLRRMKQPQPGTQPGTTGQAPSLFDKCTVYLGLGLHLGTGFGLQYAGYVGVEGSVYI